MRLLSMLMPQERRFFALFNQHASLVVDGAATLVEMLGDYSDNGRRDAYVAKIQSIEHRPGHTIALDISPHNTSSYFLPSPPLHPSPPPPPPRTNPPDPPPS